MNGSNGAGGQTPASVTGSSGGGGGGDDTKTDGKSGVADGVGPYKTVIRSAAELKSERDKKEAEAKAAEAKARSESKLKASNSIWDESDVTASIVDDDTSDGRKRAEYEIVYKQRVTTGDVYLNMGLKDISSESCESIVIRLQFPNDARASDIELIVKSDFLKAISKTQSVVTPHHLTTSPPHTSRRPHTLTLTPILVYCMIV